MDIDTLSTVINMIDNRVNTLEENCRDAETQSSIIELENLRDHLQNGIEGLINAAENRTEE